MLNLAQVAGAQPLGINPSAAPSDVGNPSSINPAARASDVWNPSAINPAAAASQIPQPSGILGFTEITPDGFRWTGERSLDGGAAWQLQADFHARRIGA
jgi:hypothetical protein